MVNVVEKKEFVKLSKDIKTFKKETKILKKEIKVLQDKVKYLQNPKCPRCYGTDIIKRGIRKNEREDITQRFTCKICDYHFTRKDLMYRMRNPQDRIIKALRLRKQGFTTSQISKKVGGVSRQTIFRWLKKYQLPTEEKEITIKQKKQDGKYYQRKIKIKI